MGKRYISAVWPGIFKLWLIFFTTRDRAGAKVLILRYMGRKGNARLQFRLIGAYASILEIPRSTHQNGL